MRNVIYWSLLGLVFEAKLYTAASVGFDLVGSPYKAELFTGELEAPTDCSPISSKMLREHYMEHYSSKLRLLKAVKATPNVELVAWCASPNLTKLVARKVIGTTDVDSGNLSWHYEIEQQCCYETFDEMDVREGTLDPNLYCADDDYLLPDRYVIDDDNNHANGLFYQGIREELIQRLAVATTRNV